LLGIQRRHLAVFDKLNNIQPSPKRSSNIAIGRVTSQIQIPFVDLSVVALNAVRFQEWRNVANEVVSVADPTTLPEGCDRDEPNQQKPRSEFHERFRRVRIAPSRNLRTLDEFHVG
jgi:hypothetical protein